MFDTILVALDLAPAEQPIIDCLPELGRWGIATKAEQVDCLHVMDATDSAATSVPASQAHQALNTLLRRIEAAGSHGDSILLQGGSANEIARHASSQDVSLIVVGKRGQNLLHSVVIGSTAANLCEIAGRPVLMVP